ncbi:MAG TPA: hypothetical protein VFQ61_28225 [Polyangiaceae bacterium]|nr:hypothetical protein [Polyangiaceae bacterium]
MVYVNVVTFDGTGYRVWQDGRTGEVTSAPSAVGAAVSAAHDLVDLVERPSDKDCGLVADALRELRTALAHARRGRVLGRIHFESTGLGTVRPASDAPGHNARTVEERISAAIAAGR